MSCGKDEKKVNPITEVKPLPPASCNDASDDFKFEQWDTSKSYIPKLNNSIVIPEAENLSTFETFYIEKRIVGQANIVTFKWLQNEDSADIFMQFSNQYGQGNILSLTRHNIGLDSVIITSWMNLSNPSPGCYRIFYALINSSKTVETKGHFDLSIE